MLKMEKELFDCLICGIVLTRGDDGATIAEMRSDYNEIMCEPWPLAQLTTLEIIRYLEKITGLRMETLASGAYVWYVDGIQDDSEIPCESTNNSYAIPAPQIQPKLMSSSLIGESDYQMAASDTLLIESIANTKSILNVPESAAIRISPICAKLVQEQDEQRINPTVNVQSPGEIIIILDNELSPNDVRKSLNARDPNDKIYLQVNCNSIPVQKQHVQENNCPSWEDNSINTSNLMDGIIPNINGSELIGDDFFLSFANLELNLQRDKYKNKPIEWGLCVSGQTIQEITQKVLHDPKILSTNEVIVNLGSIDILLGRDLYDIKSDYKRLIQAIKKRNVLPVITTLPPIQHTNNKFKKIIYQTVLLFNQFLFDYFHKDFCVIDLWSCLLNNRKPNNKYYQSNLQKVNRNGAQVEFNLWNKLGRLEILKVFKYLRCE